MLPVTKSLLMFYHALATSRIPFEYETSNFFYGEGSKWQKAEKQSHLQSVTRSTNYTSCLLAMRVTQEQS